MHGGVGGAELRGSPLSRSIPSDSLFEECALASVFTTWCCGICATSADIKTATASNVADFCCLLGTLRFLLQCDGGGHPEVVPYRWFA